MKFPLPWAAQRIVFMDKGRVVEEGDGPGRSWPTLKSEIARLYRKLLVN
jgi:ABC-type arginine transport system ATPase subunit